MKKLMLAIFICSALVGAALAQTNKPFESSANNNFLTVQTYQPPQTLAIVGTDLRSRIVFSLNKDSDYVFYLSEGDNLRFIVLKSGIVIQSGSKSMDENSALFWKIFSQYFQVPPKSASNEAIHPTGYWENGTLFSPNEAKPSAQGTACDCKDHSKKNLPAACECKQACWNRVTGEDIPCTCGTDQKCTITDTLGSTKK